MSEYYYICPYCGAFLDPGERCDCEDKKAAHAVPEERDQEESKRSGDNDGSDQSQVSQ